MGWKRHRGQIYSETAWRDRYVLRAVTCPIVGPLGDDTWDDLRAVLREHWGDCTSLANWLTSELYVRDIKRTREMEKLPPMVAWYSYPDARARYHKLPSQTTASICQQISAKYRARRYEVIWTASAALPTYRYPTPLPLPAQAVGYEEQGGAPVICVRLGDHRWRLRLRTGSRMRRQLGVLREILAGDAIPGEVRLAQRRGSGTNDHRSGLRERGAGGSYATTLTAQIAVWLPRQAPTAADGKLLVRTAADALLVAVDDEGERVWSWHAEHLPRWIAEHRRRLAAWSDDAKAEQRPVPDFAARREAAAHKQRERVSTALHTAAAQLVAYARRRRCATILYDDRDRSYVESLPWDMLARLLGEKAHAQRLAVERVSDSEKPEVARTDDGENS